jgi:hypothetical protein
MTSSTFTADSDNRVLAWSTHPASVCLAAYVLLSLLTDSHLSGDGPEYVASIVNRLHGVRKEREFWDAGHLLWRPIGYVIALGAGALGAPIRSDASAETVSRILITVSWAGGALFAAMLPLWLFRLGISWLGTVLGTLAILSANGFLQYFQGGLPYVPGLACIAVALYALESSHRSWISPALAGAAAATAVLFWLPFVFALPAVLLYPFILQKGDRRQAKLLLLPLATCAAVGILAYGSILAHLHLTSVRDVLDWVSDASHQMTRVKGVSRAVFGFARSFLNMGTDGALIKRYLLHDPYNPVSLGALFRASLFKLIYFYVLLATIAFALARWVSRRIALFCLIAAVPVLAFAVSWQGGDVERYFPLYPSFALALGACITWTPSGASVGRFISGLFVLMMVAVNVPVHSRLAFDSAGRDFVRRVAEFDDATLPPHSLVVTPSWNDPLVVYFNSGVRTSLNLRRRLPLYGLIQPGVDDAPNWPQDFAARVSEALDAKGRIWISRRLLSARPGPDWGWVEGDDPRMSWRDFPRFFEPFELGGALGGPDGFVEMLPTRMNRDRLQQITATNVSK